MGHTTACPGLGPAARLGFGRIRRLSCLPLYTFAFFVDCHVITLHTTRSTHAHIASLGRSGHPVAAAAAAKAGRQPASHDGLRANPTTAYYYGTTYLYIHIIYIPTLYMPI